MAKLIELLKRYKEIILYLIIGGLTTVINIVVYWVCSAPLSIGTVASNIIAWVVSVLFAYFTNKIFVFESKSFAPSVFFKELLLFILARVGTGALDTGIMYLLVDMLCLNEYEMWIKIGSNVLVIVLNYVLSKLIIFRKKRQATGGNKKGTK